MTVGETLHASEREAVAIGPVFLVTPIEVKTRFVPKAATV